MGNLPANRLSAGRAFLNVGIDFGGPFITKPNVSRSKVKLKSYLALFICMATKAVHLEVVSDLSADAFLAAFRRFISRRGKPTNMFSDNATNFKGASSYLKEQLKLIKSVEVQNFVTQESITWHFIPPTAAHIGGLWEAGIKSTKQLLIKTMKSAVLNFEELVTLVTQIEACLNSRPLTPLSNDPQDLQPLTPGHFLIGAPMASFPEEVPSQPACLKKRWNLIQHLRSQFWRRWHLEYLNQLQQRTKWNKPRRNLKVNDMVLVKEDNLPPLQWSLGRVVQVFPGDDGAVRVVDVKTQRGQFRRPITKFSKLLGFEPGEIKGKVESSYIADPNASFPLIYVYSDLVEPQIVGDVQAPLLKIVKVEGKDGEVVNAHYTRPHYVSVIRRHFQTVEMVLRLHSGELEVGSKDCVLRTALPFLTRGAKSVGKEVLKTGTQIVNDLLEGQNVEDAAKHRTKETGRKLAREAIKKADDMLGQGKKYKRKKRFSKHIIPSKARKAKGRDIFDT
ncbi:uncharacterized protein TNCV_4840171 [Trichonephila clavipes]|nr:uncharacterized protein TNCV_4840171 [Trichonephila clavipes]